MKRQWRNDMSQEQRAKIGTAHRGKVLSQETRRKISVSLQKYWAKLPEKPENPEGELFK